MTGFRRFGVVAAIALASAVAPAFAGNVTVGRFYTEISRVKRIVAIDAAAAEMGLRGAGYTLPELALEKTLTEGDLAAISKAVGLSVTTTRPSSFISESQMNQFFGSFGGVLGTGSIAVGDPAADEGARTRSQEGDPGQSGNGKGKKKGHNKSSSEPL